ncbi:hypothetical protein X907_1289 [Glycocaulis alkaliphilus]|uniref:Uncharacterized protein n=1 Tax=Glycocaulis alkaliphilus TaxID=1434191 RepID=A0A3T0E8T8_9PROT|nr:hypothetical protein [Glycocaulis alkaliphilus]AZU03823.1 hypothetical protein X907_1289 [Glycocaulis alkaliphilus]GGB86473.1 hypothetical protein GCM10007417_28180 [Glycocaulis alkaliphilus]
MKNILRCSVILPALLLSASPALGDEPPADLFQRAVATAQLHNDRAGEVCGFAYAPHWNEDGGFIVEQGEGAARWLDARSQPLDEELAANFPEDPRQMIRQSPDRLLESADTPRFVRWEDGLAIYQFQPVSLPLAGGGFSFDVAENVVAEVGIDPDTAMVAFREVKAPSSFRPNAVVRIRDYETRVNFRPAWPDGPVVVADQRYAIVAVAMLQTHNLTGSSTYSGFTRCEAG